MNKKILSFGSEAREKLLKGVETVAEAVGATLGPKGSNVAIEREYGSPIVLHDGVSVAREVDLVDPYENMGAQLVKEAASKTNDAAGDGTTTATVLAYALASGAHKNITAGSNAMMMRRGIERAVDAMTDELHKLAIPITKHEEVLQVATISAQNEQIGKIVAEGMERMGKDGVLAVEESGTSETYLEIKEGMEFSQGFISHYFVTNPELQEASLENPYILVTDLSLQSNADIIPLLKKFAESQTENKNLVIIADDISGEALALLVLNKLKNVINAVAIKSPAFGEKRKDMLKDIAIVTGATYVSSDAGMRLTAESFELDMLGRSGRVTSTKENTVIIDGVGSKEAIDLRIKELRNTLEKTEVDFDREKIQERIAKLTAGVGVIFVGASSETEMRERKERVIDAISATKAAMSEGIVPGGETALIRASLILEDLKAEGDELLGIKLVKSASRKPFDKLMSNAGFDSGRMFAQLESVFSKRNYGIDVIDGQIKDLVKNGVIDPVRVTRSALSNAASVAAMIMTTNVLIATEPQKQLPTYEV